MAILASRGLRRRGTYRLLALVASVVLLSLPAPVHAQDIVFSETSAEGELGEPIVFRTEFTAAATPTGVEVLLRLAGDEELSVLPADVLPDGDGWRAQTVLGGDDVWPNTRFLYSFRVREAGGGDTLSPESEIVIRDERFTWQTIEGTTVRLHWYEGNEAFAERALEVGEEAVENASELLGASLPGRVDFFVYASEEALREAVQPIRENVAGQAVASIGTMFAYVTPEQVGSDFVDILVAHELTHLVFDAATENPYHAPPTWLDEGVAVYLSEGYNEYWRDVLDVAVASRNVIPLDGLGGLFPTTAEQFELAYAESVSAVDYFVRTYDERTLWALVRSYADGVSDDEAFTAATGADLAAFNAAWMASLGLEVPEPHGPVEGLPGPVPAEWNDGASPTPDPSASPSDGTAVGGPAATSGPRPGPTEGAQAPSAPDAGGGAGGSALAIGVPLGVLVVIAIAVLGLLARRRLLT